MAKRKNTLTEEQKMEIQFLIITGLDSERSAIGLGGEEYESTDRRDYDSKLMAAKMLFDDLGLDSSRLNDL